MSTATVEVNQDLLLKTNSRLLKSNAAKMAGNHALLLAIAAKLGVI